MYLFNYSNEFILFGKYLFLVKNWFVLNDFCCFTHIGHAVNIQTTAAMAKEYLNGTSQMPMETISDGKSTPAVRPKEQLLYLAQLLGFRVQFSDFPKVSFFYCSKLVRSIFYFWFGFSINFYKTILLLPFYFLSH